MKKHEVLKVLSDVTGVKTAEVEKVLEALPALVVREIDAGNELVLPGVGKFKPKRLPDRMGRNPKTNEEMPISAKNSLSYRPAAEIRNGLRQ